MEPDGKYRMVISNRPRSIGPIYKNKPFGYEGGGRPGMIFFNDEGTENGGLTFTGSTCTSDKSVTTGRACTKGTYQRVDAHVVRSVQSGSGGESGLHRQQRAAS